MASSETSFDGYTFTYKWKVNNLAARLYNPSELRSPTFTSPGGAIYKPATKWMLTIIISNDGGRGHSHRQTLDDKSVTVLLNRLASDPETTAEHASRISTSGPPRQKLLRPGQDLGVQQSRRDDNQNVWVEASLMPLILTNDATNQRRRVFQGPVSLRCKSASYAHGSELLFERILTSSKIRGSNSVIFECEIKVWLLDKPIHVNKEPISLSCKSEFNLSKCMQEARQSNLFTDVTLIVADGKEFKAHKVVLASQSEFFKTRFASRWSGSSGDKVEMTDVPASIMEGILSYMYTGIVTNIQQIAYQLLPAAEEYALVGLRGMCEQTLAKSLTIKTVADVLIHADAHHTSDLKKACMDFILSNIVSVKQSEGWGKLKEHRDLWVDLLESIAEKHSTATAAISTDSTHSDTESEEEITTQPAVYQW